ncbi:MAG: hypothetical protein LLF76_02285 [Planctomycetaceae bacterium]|nr:hypothetical protein [Planctomycetaceae bacterium]
MHESQQTKKVLLIPPQVADGAAFARPAAADCAGVRYAEFLLATGAMDDVIGTTDTATAPQLEECDTNSVTAGDWSVIPDAELAAVIPNTGDDKLYQIDVNFTRAVRKRFVRPKALNAGATTNGAALCAIAILHGLDTGPVTAAERGLAAHVMA